MKNGDKVWFKKYLDAKFETINEKIDHNRSDIADMKSDIKDIKRSLLNMKLSASIIGAVGGVIAGIVTYFGINSR